MITLAMFGMVVAVVVGVIVVVLAATLARRTARESREQETRSRESLAQFREEVSRELGRLNSSLVTSVASSGQTVTQAQQRIDERLQGSQRVLQEVHERLATIQKASDDLSQSNQALQTILGGVKTRGILGEITLEKMLEDALPADAYDCQHSFASGDVVDTVVRIGDHLLPVDSKFPLESYRRLVNGDESARKDFFQAVRKHADSIAQKYIRPQDGTLEIALMFVPSETVYYELITCEDDRLGMLGDYCRARKVFPVSPNTFYACLMAIKLGHTGMRLQENTRILLGQLGGLQKDLDGFATYFQRVGTHLRNAQQNYEQGESRFSGVKRTVDRLAAVSISGGEVTEREVLVTSIPEE
jgi:DNA recombination protein RmuC